MRFRGPKEIKDHVRRILSANADTVKGMVALDFPAGNGVTSEYLASLGAQVQALDLFPELFRISGVAIARGDLGDRFPLPDAVFDLAICQEGIEHIGQQEHVFQEFARVTKAGGRLFLTTPNYSNIKSKLSYLLCESEAFGRIMPANEHDSVWLAPSAGPGEPRVYFGHVFLTGFFRLRLFAKLAGFSLIGIHDSRVNMTSLLFFPLLYPLITLHSWRTYRRFIRKGGSKALAKDLLRWMVSPKLLLENHLILEFRRDSDPVSVTQPVEGQATFQSFTT